ncbi:MAG: 4'-phosphopantetheinyl transferase superfamily protein [Planctomycetes bacterium]|nr:4'-phosphopantetheinyl transferase superfamily protein [Planctomycetota bacterium]
MEELALHDTFAVTRAGSPTLVDGELHVWAVPLTGDAERLGANLSKAENQRLSRFHFADHRRRFQIGHGALRLILAGYLGCGPADVEFAAGPRGKPFLAAPGPHFNLSHSGKLALIGVSKTEVGLDVEKVRRLDSLTEIARKHFSPSEFAALDALQGEARELAFYRCWTRKEAYIKALGEGLSMPLDVFDVSLCDEPRLVAIRDGKEDAAKWSMLDVSPGPEFVGAAAMRALGVRVQRYRLADA